MNQFQGEMDIILEYLRGRKDSTTLIVVVDTPTEIVAQLVPNQENSILGPNSHVVAYP